MTCELNHKQMLDYLYGELSTADKQTFESHLKTCAHCTADLAAYRNVRSTLGSIEHGELSHATEQSILELAKTQAPILSSEPWWSKLQGLFVSNWWMPMTAGAAVVALVVVVSLDPKKSVEETSRVILEPAPSAHTESEMPAAPEKKRATQPDSAASKAPPINPPTRRKIAVERKSSKKVELYQNRRAFEELRSRSAPKASAGYAAGAENNTLGAAAPAAKAAYPKEEARAAEPSTAAAQDAFEKSETESDREADTSGEQPQDTAAPSISQALAQAQRAVNSHACETAFKLLESVLKRDPSRVASVRRVLGACTPELPYYASQYPHLNRAIRSRTQGP